MSGIGFAHADWLIPVGLAWLGLGAALGFARYRARQRRRLLLGPGAGNGPAAPDGLPLLALLALALALLGPQWGTHTLRVPASGVDVVLLLDVSRSMNAQDVPPSRLARARQAAAGLLERLAPGDRAALAAFAARGVLLTPLTPDFRALHEMLPAFDETLLSEQGSSLASGVSAALPAFREGSPRPRVLVVLSDGEAPGGPAPAGARPANRARVRVVSIALGGEAGVSVPDNGAALEDAYGGRVLTRRDAKRLAALARDTGGAVFLADAWGEVELDAVLAAVRRDATAAPAGFVERHLPRPRFAPFVALALLLLALDALGLPRVFAPGWPARGSGFRSPGFRSSRFRNVALILAGLLVLGAGPSSGRDAQAAQLLQTGIDRAEAGDLDGARRAFLAAALGARSRRLAGDAYFDLGVAALRGNDLGGARDAFLDAIALAPGDREAQFNLEWTLRRMALPPPSAPPPEAGTGDEPEQAEQTDEEAEGEREAGETSEAKEASAESARPTGREETGRDEAAREAVQLSEEEARRWLDAVADDPARALRAAARDELVGPRPAPDAPAW